MNVRWADDKLKSGLNHIYPESLSPVKYSTDQSVVDTKQQELRSRNLSSERPAGDYTFKNATLDRAHQAESINSRIARKVSDIVREQRGSQEKLQTRDPDSIPNNNSTGADILQTEQPVNSLNRLKKSIRESLDKIDIFSDMISKDSAQKSFDEQQQQQRDKLDKSNKTILDDLKQLSLKNANERSLMKLGPDRHTLSREAQFWDRENKDPFERKDSANSGKMKLSQIFLSTQEARQIFSNSIKKMARLCQELDQSKRDMFANPDFNAQKLFRLIDSKREEKISFEEFKKFLTKIEITCKNQDLLLDLFTSCDHGSKYYLKSSEFERLLYPQDRRVVREGALNDREFYRLTMNDVRETFEKHLKLRELLLNIRMDLSDQNIDLEQIFEALNVSCSGTLDKDDIARLLGAEARPGPEKRDGEISLVYDLIDFDCDGRISFKDFFMTFSI